MVIEIEGEGEGEGEGEREREREIKQKNTIDSQTITHNNKTNKPKSQAF